MAVGTGDIIAAGRELDEGVRIALLNYRTADSEEQKEVLRRVLAANIVDVLNGNNTAKKINLFNWILELAFESD